MMKYERELKRGISIIEALLSLALFSFSLVALQPLLFSIGENSDLQLSRTQELLTAKSNIDEQELSAHFDGVQSSKELSATGSHAFLLQTLATNWKDAEGGSTCSIPQNQAWSILNVSGSIDLGANNMATALAARGNYVYLTANSATKTDPDFFVVDVSNKAAPFIVSKLDTGPGLTAIKIAGTYAYVGNSSINAQLQIVDIHDPTQPSLVSSFKIPGAYSDSTTIPNSLFLYKSRLYIGTKKSQIAEFHIIDVSNVAAPKELGSYELNTQVNDMVVEDAASGTLAYIASPDDNELIVLNVSDPSNIVKIGTYNASGSYGSGKSLFQTERNLYLGRTKDALATGAELHILNNVDPSAITASSTITIGSSINGVVSNDHLLFLETEKAGDNFQVWNVDDPARPFYASSTPLSFPAKPIALSCSGDAFYVALQSNDALRIISYNEN